MCQRFDVMENLEKFCKILGTKNRHIIEKADGDVPHCTAAASAWPRRERAPPYRCHEPPHSDNQISAH